MIANRTEDNHVPAAAASTADRPDRTQWLVALVLFGAGVAVALEVGKAVAALPAMRSELGFSLATGGWLIGGVQVISALCGLLVGATIDRLGHRRAALSGLAVAAACSAVGATAHTAPLLLATRLGEGLGFIVTALAVPSLLVRITAKRDHGTVFGIWSAYIPVGIALAIVATPLLLANGGWRGLWLATAALTAVWAVVLAAATRNLQQSRPEVGSPLLPIVRSVASSPRALTLAGIFAAYAFQFLAVFGFLPTLLGEDHHLTSNTIALLSAIAVLANVPGNILGGWLQGRGAQRWVLICGASAIMATASLGIYMGGLPLEFRYTCCIVFSLAGAVIPAVLLGAAPEFAPSPQAVAATVGLVTQGAMIGQVAGPPTIAALATAVGGWGASSIPLGLAAIVAAGLSLLLRSYEQADRQ